MAIIQVNGLTKIFKKGPRANDNITLSFQKGEVVGLIGPNGAGKTTLLRQITGELLPTEGEIKVKGIDVLKKPNSIKPYLGVCPQEGTLFSYLTVWEHIYYFGRLKRLNTKEAKNQTEKILEILELIPHSGKKIRQLSGGLKKRVFVAISLIGNPEIIILDEPTTGLDPSSRLKLWETIKNIKEREKDITIIITTHYLDELEYLSERVVFLNEGKVVLDGTSKEIKNLVLNYDLKIRLNGQYQREVENILSVNMLDARTEIDGELLNVFLNYQDAGEVIPVILNLTKNINIAAPTLDEVFVEVTRNAKSVY